MSAAACELNTHVYVYTDVYVFLKPVRYILSKSSAALRIFLFQQIIFFCDGLRSLFIGTLLHMNKVPSSDSINIVFKDQ